MIRDAYTRFATAQRPLLSLGSAGFNFYPLPSGHTALGGTPLVFDLQTLMDKGQGRPITARFNITSPFTTGDATQQVRFAVAVCGNTDGIVDTGTNGLVVQSSGIYLPTAGSYGALVAGSFVEVMLPRLPSVAHALALSARRYVALGLEISTAVAAGNALFTGGALDAFLTLDSQGEETRFTTGFTVQ